MDGKPKLEDVIRHYSGCAPTRRMTHCPLHDDKTPSCSVNYTRQLWNCHSCGNGGDSWALIQLKESCDFKTATMLAKKYDFEAREEEGEVHGNRFTGSKRATQRGRDGKKATYRPRFARGD